MRPYELMRRGLMEGQSPIPPTTPHRYWRISVSAPESSTLYIGFTEVEMRGPGGGANLIPPQANNVRTEASSWINSSNAAYMAADGSLTTGWLSSSPGAAWWQFDFNTSPADVRQIAIRGSYNAPTASPKDFELQWSDDGDSWVTALTVTGQTGWAGASDMRMFDVP